MAALSGSFPVTVRRTYVLGFLYSVVPLYRRGFIFYTQTNVLSTLCRKIFFENFLSSFSAVYRPCLPTKSKGECLSPSDNNSPYMPFSALNRRNLSRSCRYRHTICFLRGRCLQRCRTTRSCRHTTSVLRSYESQMRYALPFDLPYRTSHPCR